MAKKGGQDLKHAEYHRRLFEHFLEKTDHSKDFEGRQREACEMMSEKLGDDWKEKANPDGIVFISVEKPSKLGMKEKLNQYHSALDHEGDKEGLGPAPEAPEPDEDDVKGDMMSRLKKVLHEVL